MSSRTYVVGVGMMKFDKPGTKEGDYPDWAREAGERQVDGAGVALQHNIGLGGAAVVTVYRPAA